MVDTWARSVGNGSGQSVGESSGWNAKQGIVGESHEPSIVIERTTDGWPSTRGPNSCPCQTETARLTWSGSSGTAWIGVATAHATDGTRNRKNQTAGSHRDGP